METLLLVIYGKMSVYRSITDNWAVTTHMRYHAPSEDPFCGKDKGSASLTRDLAGNVRQTEVTQLDVTRRIEKEVLNPVKFRRHIEWSY
jgi:hypothetical protein